MESLAQSAAKKKIYMKWKLGEPLVFTRDSVITNKPINRGMYIYTFAFDAPNGEKTVSSLPGFIVVENGKVLKFNSEEFKGLIATANAENNQ